MSASRLRSLSYLAYRAFLAHPFKRLGASGTGLERFLASYAGEGLVPTALEDRALDEAASACIACGLCEPACELAGVIPSVRDLGVHAAFRLYGRSGLELAHAREALAECARCGGRCDGTCPTGVPISRIVKRLLARATEAP